MALFVGTLLFHASGVLWTTLKFHSTSTTPLQIPLWLPQSIWLAGYVFFALTIVVLACTSLNRLRRQRWASVSGLIGINSVEEDIEEETHRSAPGLTPSPTTGEH
ncbi:hypothetical protein D9M70_638230 [compost metagenome]